MEKLSFVEEDPLASLKKSIREHTGTSFLEKAQDAPFGLGAQGPFGPSDPRTCQDRPRQVRRAGKFAQRQGVHVGHLLTHFLTPCT